MNQWEVRQRVIDSFETPEDRRKRKQENRKFYARLLVTILALIFIFFAAMVHSSNLVQIITGISGVAFAYLILS